MGIFDRFGKKNASSNDQISAVEKEYKRGLQLLNSTDINEAHRGYDIIGPLAAGGYAEAQVTMGMFVEEKFGNVNQAIIWYKRAAEQGHPQGQRCYADMLMTGRGINEDRGLALKYYELAANQGVVEAQFVMGEFCRNNGKREQAYSWYKKALDGGYKNASIRIQQMNSEER